MVNERTVIFTSLIACHCSVQVSINQSSRLLTPLLGAEANLLNFNSWVSAPTSIIAGQTSFLVSRSSNHLYACFSESCSRHCASSWALLASNSYYELKKSLRSWVLGRINIHFLKQLPQVHSLKLFSFPESYLYDGEWGGFGSTLKEGLERFVSDSFLTAQMPPPMSRLPTPSPPVNTLVQAKRCGEAEHLIGFATLQLLKSGLLLVLSHIFFVTA